MAEWNMTKQACGNRIRQAREQREWSITELSVQADVSAEQISRYENGIKSPGYETLIKLAEALKVPLDTFQPESLDKYGACTPEDVVLLEALHALSPLKKAQAYESMLSILQLMK